MANDGVYPPRNDVAADLDNAARIWGEERAQLGNKWEELKEELRKLQNLKGQTQNASLEAKIKATRREMVEVSEAGKRAGNRARAASDGWFLFQEEEMRNPRFTQRWNGLYAKCQKAGLTKNDMDEVAAQATRTATPSAKTLGER